MTNIFTNWIPRVPSANVQQEEILFPLPSNVKQSHDLGLASTLDRLSNMASHISIQPPSASFTNDHVRGASDATLLAESRLSQPSHLVYVEQTESPRNSDVHASDHSHYARLGGVDSEAAWSETQAHALAPTTQGHHVDSTKHSLPKRKRKLVPPELLVIVKPPPSKQNNPLNLQIQLVMPQQLHKREASRVSGETPRSADAQPAPGLKPPLRRSNSVGSTRSASSHVSTAPSTSSTSSGRRVTPLYNLSYHTLLPTTVSDAGTDQKVAKYSKKGVDLEGFGLLEPQELILGVNDLKTLHRSGRTGTEAASNEYAGPNTSTFPTSSIQEQPFASTSANGFESSSSLPATHPDAKGIETHVGGKLLNKFKRLSMGMKPASLTAPAASVMAGQSNFAEKSNASVFGLGKLTNKVANVDIVSSMWSDIPQLSPGAGTAQGKRTEGYYWTVKKWNRRMQDGISSDSPGPKNLPDGTNPVLTNVWKRFNLVNRMGGNEQHPPASAIPIRFEWTRNSKRRPPRRSTGETRARLLSRTSIDRVALGEAANQSKSSLHSQGLIRASMSSSNLSERANALHPSRAESASMPYGDKKSKRSSYIAGGRSPRRSMDVSIAGSSGAGDEVDGEGDSGEDSDPEDSETPWNCHLVLGPTTRIPLGTLSPAPHHPKLVGQLAVPFPLPDLSTTGLGQDGAGLTREELKDVIIVTCLHLIVRESFGGLAKRKGGIPTSLSGLSESGSGQALSAVVNGWRLANAPKRTS